MKSKTILVLLGFFLGITINTGMAVSKQQDATVSLVDYSLHSAATLVSALHQIKIEEVPRLESSLEAFLAQDIIGLGQELKADTLSQIEREGAVTMITLVSVMNEKFVIKSWRENDRLQEIFEEAQALVPNEAEKFRCKDWSQPMWVGTECE